MSAALGAISVRLGPVRSFQRSPSTTVAARVDVQGGQKALLWQITQTAGSSARETRVRALASRVVSIDLAISTVGPHGPSLVLTLELSSAALIETVASDRYGAMSLREERKLFGSRPSACVRLVVACFELESMTPLVTALLPRAPPGLAAPSPSAPPQLLPTTTCDESAAQPLHAAASHRPSAARPTGDRPPPCHASRAISPVSEPGSRCARCHARASPLRPADPAWPWVPWLQRAAHSLLAPPPATARFPVPPVDRCASCARAQSPARVGEGCVSSAGACACASHPNATRQQSHGSAAQWPPGARLAPVSPGKPELSRWSTSNLSATSAESGLAPGVQLTVLPRWVRFVPPQLYSAWLRRCIEGFVALWSAVSIVWAFWQLYRNLPLLHELLSPLVRLLHRYLDAVLSYANNALHESTELWASYLRPLQLLVGPVSVVCEQALAAALLAGASLVQAGSTLVAPMSSSLGQLAVALRSGLSAARATLFATSRLFDGWRDTPLVLGAYAQPAIDSVVSLARLARSTLGTPLAHARALLTRVRVIRPARYLLDQYTLSAEVQRFNAIKALFTKNALRVVDGTTCLASPSGVLMRLPTVRQVIAQQKLTPIVRAISAYKRSKRALKEASLGRSRSGEPESTAGRLPIVTAGLVVAVPSTPESRISGPRISQGASADIASDRWGRWVAHPATASSSPSL